MRSRPARLPGNRSSTFHAGVPPTRQHVLNPNVGITANYADDYCAEALYIFQRMNPKPSAARRYLINDLIQNLKYNNVWTSLDQLFVLAAKDSASALINWKAPDNRLVPTGSLSFAADAGYAGGTVGTTFLNSTIPFAAGNFTLNNAHIGFWNFSIGSSFADCGSNGGSFQHFLLARNPTTADFQFSLNDTAAILGGTPGPAYFIASRTAPSSRQGYRNGVLNIADGAAATITPTTEVLACLSSGSLTTDGRNSIVHCGPGLTAFQAGAAYAAFNSYMTRLSQFP